jgi:protein TonB
MFTALVESAPRNSRAAGRSAISLVLHAAAGIGLVHASRRVEASPPPRVIDVTLPAPVSRPEAPARAARAPVVPESSQWRAPANIVLPPDGVLVSIPPADPGPPIDPRRLAPPTPGVPLCFVACGGGSPSADSVFRAESVDEPASVVSQPVPVYPPMLRAAGLAGRVPLEFTVDSTGRVEAGSIRSLEPVHPAFVASATAAIEGSRFSPARNRGRAVRQLVRQSIVFRLDP